MNICGKENCNKECFEGRETCLLHDVESENNIPASFFLESFINKFIKYISMQISTNTDFQKYKISKNNLDEFLNNQIEPKHNNKNFDNIDKAIRNTIHLMIEDINFPFRTNTINHNNNHIYDYSKILNLFDNITFIKCNFYSSDLNLNGNCILKFTRCYFYKEWKFYDHKPFVDMDDIVPSVYNLCTFKERVINGSIVYNNCQFDHYCRFEDSIVLENCKINENIFIKDKIHNPILNNLDLFKNHLIEIINIYNCTFENDFELNEYTINEFKCEKCTFNKKFEIARSQFKYFNMHNCEFYDYFSLSENSFKGYFKIANTYFDNLVFINNSEFLPYKQTCSNPANFNSSTFNMLVSFINSDFTCGLDFSTSYFKNDANFLNTKISYDNTSRETYRMIKHSFDKVANHIEANKYFSNEMKKYNDELSLKPLYGHIQEKLIFNINKFVSNFGQNYFKPIILIIVLLFIYNVIIFIDNNNLLSGKYDSIDFLININYMLNTYLSNNILPFSKLLKDNMEFISLIFHILFSLLIWQTIVAIKRHTRR